jgi:hypothetical protein
MAAQASALRGKTRFGAAIRHPHETGNNFHGLSRHDVSGHGSARRSDSPAARVAISRCGWTTRCAACHGAAGQNVNRTERGVIYQGEQRRARAGTGTARRGNNATRGDTAGQFARARRSKACLGMAKNGGAIRTLERHLGQFLAAEPGSAQQCRAGRGEATAQPRAVSGAISRGVAGHRVARIGWAGLGEARQQRHRGR